MNHGLARMGHGWDLWSRIVLVVVAMRGDERSGAVIGAAMEVHNALGHGFLEQVYLEALCAEFRARAIPYRRQVPIPVFYKAERLPCGYRADLLCHEDLIVELKAQAGLTEVDEAQVINYLRATELEKALLFNFGTPRLQIKRLILTEEFKRRMVRTTPR